MKTMMKCHYKTIAVANLFLNVKIINTSKDIEQLKQLISCGNVKYYTDFAKIFGR